MADHDAAAQQRIGLVLIDPPGFDEEVFSAFGHAGLHATFFVRPELLVRDAMRWRFAVAAGHELGDGCLLGVTDDGRLPGWTCAALDAELQESARLLRELGQAEAVSCFLPGRFHLCAEGRYRHKVQRVFPICVGTSERCQSLLGVVGAAAWRETGARFLHVAANAESVRGCLRMNQGLAVGPLRDLVSRSPHT